MPIPCAVLGRSCRSHDGRIDHPGRILLWKASQNRPLLSGGRPGGAHRGGVLLCKTRHVYGGRVAGADTALSPCKRACTDCGTRCHEGVASRSSISLPRMHLYCLGLFLCAGHLLSRCVTPGTSRRHIRGGDWQPTVAMNVWGSSETTPGLRFVGC